MFSSGPCDALEGQRGEGLGDTPLPVRGSGGGRTCSWDPGLGLLAPGEVLVLSPGLGSKLKAPSGSIAKNNSYNMVAGRGGERASCGEARL